VLAVDSKYPRAISLLFNVSAAVISLSIYFVTGEHTKFALPSEPIAYISLLVAVVCYGLFERLRFVAAKLLDASVLTTIGNLSVFVAFIGALILYKETVTPGKILGGFLIIIALLIVSTENLKGKNSLKGVAVGIFTSILIGIAWMLDKLGAGYFNANTYSILVWTLPIVFIIFPYIKFSEIKSELKQASWKVVVLAGINVFGYLLQLKALEIAEATRVIPIVQTSILLTIILGVIFLNERNYVAKKIIAGIMAIAGAYFLI